MTLLVFLWFVAGDERLSRTARRAIDATSGQWWLSAASDPFDRLIVAQARAEGLAVVTKDRVFAEYGVRVVW